MKLPAGMIALSFCCLAPSVQACEQLKVQDAWIREAPPGAMAMAGYAQLRNTGKTALRLTAIASPDFASAEVHESRIVDGQMRMRPLGPLVLAPGQTLLLSPAGNHLMLMGPKPAFSGKASTIEWHCGKQISKTLFPVRKAD